MEEGADMTGRQQRGFTLVELMVSMAVLLIIVGAVFQLLSQTQSRSVAASTVEDTTSFSRDALDQMLREIRLSGYPAPLSYPPGVITAANVFHFYQDGVLTDARVAELQRLLAAARSASPA